MESDISLPKKQRIIYSLCNFDDLYVDVKIDKENIKMIKDENYLNIYRWEKILDDKIEPNIFFYYYKQTFYRSRLNKHFNSIIFKEEINENEWIEELNYHGENKKIKFLNNEYELISYMLKDEDNNLFELFSFKIREYNGKYLLRLEMAFKTFNIEQEMTMSNQIYLINKFEKVIIENRTLLS